MLTVLVAIIATLAFESPIVVIEKVIFGSGKKSGNVSNDIQPNGSRNNTVEN